VARMLLPRPWPETYAPAPDKELLALPRVAAMRTSGASSNGGRFRTLQHHHDPALMRSIQMTICTRLGGLSVALAVLGLGVPQASACGWWWACGDTPYAYRPGPNRYGYGYRSRPRAHYAYRGPAWVYGYSNPARAWDPYAAWPSTSIPQSRWFLSTALPVRLTAKSA
jgi:hypothetical protein